MKECFLASKIMHDHVDIDSLRCSSNLWTHSVFGVIFVAVNLFDHKKKSLRQHRMHCHCLTQKITEKRRLHWNMKMSSFVGAAISRSFDTLLGHAGTLKTTNFNLCNEKLKKQQPQQRELDRRSRKKLFMIRKFMHGLIFKMQIYSDCTHQLTSMISHELHHCAFVESVFSDDSWRRRRSLSWLLR